MSCKFSANAAAASRTGPHTCSTFTNSMICPNILPANSRTSSATSARFAAKTRSAVSFAASACFHILFCQGERSCNFAKCIEDIRDEGLSNSDTDDTSRYFAYRQTMISSFHAQARGVLMVRYKSAAKAAAASRTKSVTQQSPSVFTTAIRRHRSTWRTSSATGARFAAKTRPTCSSSGFLNTTMTSRTWPLFRGM